MLYEELERKKVHGILSPSSQPAHLHGGNQSVRKTESL
jgi:hypothetical protein